MCGIVGFYTPNSDFGDRIQSNIERMMEKIIHRGPDASGVWIEPGNRCLVMGHRRLSIIDLTETGSQPMISHSRRFVISYNGEIYNTDTLLDELHRAGYTERMYGTSDTEVLLEAIDRFGVKETLVMCKGMFAFALYDREENTLTLARDRIGEKPLYYGEVEGNFVFASELGAIRAFEGFSNEFNTDCIADYLKHGYVPAPRTIYRNIYKLEPGCTLKIKCEVNKWQRYEIDPYWDIEAVAARGQSSRFSGSRAEAAEVLEGLLTRSVKQQMISDVPLGAFLSSGIDSATIVALMQSQSVTPVRTFTIGFEEEAFNEADDAAEIARRLGTEHTELYATRQDAIDAIPLMSQMFGEPFADSSQIPTYLVSKLTRKHVTVALSGDAGDELFAGYRDYTGVNNIYRKIKNIPVPMRKVGGNLMRICPGASARAEEIRAHGTLLAASDAVDLYRRTYETWRGLDGLIGKATIRDRDPKKIGRTCIYDTIECGYLKGDVIHTAMLMNMKMYLPDDILTKVDRTAMAVSLETRIPLLDRDVVEFAWTLPLEHLREGDTGKMVLRDILYKYVDKSLMDRPKHGFSVPVSEWLREGELHDWAADLLNSDSINRLEILDRVNVTNLWNDYVSGGPWRKQIWHILMLYDWLRENI
ncbi:asparagine synthase (glutamine-hydrolysing) [Lachnospiraceae bacterium XBB2008]|nr:asparagine synthase (glutamine-hydrolysing) [Lachnospiraceae bacterium XBB2008]